MGLGTGRRAALGRLAPMGYAFIVLGALVVVAIGLVAVGRVTAELAAEPRLSVFDLDEAVEWVADRLSTETAGQLSYDDVRTVLGWHLDYLEARGAAFEGPATGTGRSGEGPVVTVEDDAVAFVLGKADEAAFDVADERVAEVLDLQMRYLDAIGAIGPAVPEPPDPAP